MNVDKKLKAFSAMAMQQVENQHQQNAEEIQETIAVSVERAKREAEQMKQDMVRTEQAKMEREANKMISAAASAAKQEMSDLRERLTEELFTVLRADLYSYTETPGYADKLIKELIETHGGFSTVQLMARDMFLASRAESETGLRVESTDEDFIGGFKLLAENRMDDRSFAERLRDIRADFSLA